MTSTTSNMPLFRVWWNNEERFYWGPLIAVQHQVYLDLVNLQSFPAVFGMERVPVVELSVDQMLKETSKGEKSGQC